VKSSSSGNIHFVKLDKGEDVLAILTEYISTADIKSGTFSAIGVLRDTEVGYYELEKAQYIKKTFKGDFELLSLSGNIGELNGKRHPHIHVILGDKDSNCYGGHLLNAKVGVTCEVFITATVMELERIYDDKIKLNLLSPKP
jgi:predicted DNA-binding protein with PD1-like motif